MRKTGRDQQTGIRDQGKEAHVMQETAFLLRVVSLCRALLVSILLLVLPPRGASAIQCWVFSPQSVSV